MRLRLGIFAVLSLAVLVLAAGIASFAVDPGSVGIRLALYVLSAVAATGVILFAVFAFALPVFGRTGVTPAQLAEARAAGREAYARVRSAAPTGGRLNGAWAYDARLVVAATDVPPYEVTDRVRVHRMDGRLSGRGEVVTIVRLAADAPQVVVTAGPSSTPQNAAVPKQAPAWPGAEPG